MQARNSPNEVYQVGRSPIQGLGIELLDDFFDESRCLELRSMHRDEPGVADLIEQLVLSGDDTKFDMTLVKEVLGGNPPPEEDWRVGETIASYFLQTFHGYVFPWPASRDARNNNGSLPGADNVGFRSCADGRVRFAFGETKTSSSAQRPPNTLYGRTGMVNQLLERMPDKLGSSQLIRYIGFHSKGDQENSDRFHSAFDSFLNHDQQQPELVGVAIRPLTPDQDDLRARVATLLRRNWVGRDLTLFALYVPGNIFKTLRSAWKP